MNHAQYAIAHEIKIRRWQTFTPPQSAAHAAHCGLVLHWRAYRGIPHALEREPTPIHSESAQLEEPTSKDGRLDKINAGIRQALAEHQAEMSSIKARSAEWNSQEASGTLKREAIEKMQLIDHKLNRALSGAKRETYEEDGLLLDDGDLPYWHFLDIEEAAHIAGSWQQYLPADYYQTISDTIAKHAEDIDKVLNEYESWAAKHEPPKATNKIVFDFLVAIGRLDSVDFPGDRITLNDQEFKEFGAAGGLVSHARLAEFDPERFRRMFGAMYTPEYLAEGRGRYEKWERDNPTTMPRRLPEWERIEHCVSESQGNRL